MKKSEENLNVIQNFILHYTHDRKESEKMYQAALDYIKEDHVDGEPAEETKPWREIAKQILPELKEAHTILKIVEKAGHLQQVERITNLLYASFIQEMEDQDQDTYEWLSKAADDIEGLKLIITRVEEKPNELIIDYPFTSETATFYLFADEWVYDYLKDKEYKHIQAQDFQLHCYDPDSNEHGDIGDLLHSFMGWEQYATISVEDFKILLDIQAKGGQ